MVNRLNKEIENMTRANKAFTEALQALETDNFKLTIDRAEEVLKCSNSIEQRSGALFLMTLASSADPLLKTAMLNLIYETDN